MIRPKIQLEEPAAGVPALLPCDSRLAPPPAAAPWLLLPDTLLSALFTAAGPEALPTLRLVCKSFLQPANEAVRRLKPRRLAVVGRGRFGNLRDLDAEAVGDWSEALLSQLPKHTPLLESLKLGRYQLLTFVGAEQLCRLARLQHLDLSGSTLPDSALLRLMGLGCTLLTLSLRDCCHVSGAGLARLLGALPRLTYADLSNCCQLGDAALEQLAGSCSQLTKLDLTSCQGFSEAGLRHLAHLPLRTLLLSACCQLTDGCLAAVAEGLPQLSCLGLFEAGESVTDAGLAHLSRLAGSLTALDLGYSCWAHTDTGLAALLAKLTNLRMLNIGGCEGSTDAVSAVVAQHCRQLTQLDVSESQRMTAAGVRHLAQLSHLAELNLGWNIRLKDEALEGLARGAAAPAVEAAVVAAPAALAVEAAVVARAAAVVPVEAAAPVLLAGAPPLAGPTATAALAVTRRPAVPPVVRLDLSFCCDVTDRALAHAARLPLLASLSLRKCSRITDEGLHHLAACTALTHLDFSYCATITAGGLSALRCLPRLTSLVLVGCIKGVRPPSLAMLAQHHSLSTLDLSDNKHLDDGCVQAVSHAFRLRSLSLNSCTKVSDRGLMALSRITHLNHLSVDRCPQLSSGALARLQRRLPLLRLSRPGGGQGVMAQGWAPAAEY